MARIHLETLREGNIVESQQCFQAEKKRERKLRRGNRKNKQKSNL
jgi:hypothetical protein